MGNTGLSEKIPNDLIGNETRDPASYNAVVQPTVLARALQWSRQLYPSMQPLSWHVNRAARLALWHSSNLYQTIKKKLCGYLAGAQYLLYRLDAEAFGRTANNNRDESQKCHLNGYLDNREVRKW